MSNCLCTSYVAHFTPSQALVPGAILQSTATVPSQLACAMLQELSTLA